MSYKSPGQDDTWHSYSIQGTPLFEIKIRTIKPLDPTQLRTLEETIRYFLGGGGDKQSVAEDDLAGKLINYSTLEKVCGGNKSLVGRVLNSVGRYKEIRRQLSGHTGVDGPLSNEDALALYRRSRKTINFYGCINSREWKPSRPKGYSIGTFEALQDYLIEEGLVIKKIHPRIRSLRRGKN